MKAKEEILNEYEQKSLDPEYAKYSPLQCAADDNNLDAVKVLIDHYKEIGHLSERLSYKSGDYEENILHIAMKNIEIFKICCEELNTYQLLETTLGQTDAENDTIAHQLIEFGRKDALEYLANNHRDFLLPSLSIKNINNETPLEIAENYEKSETIELLRNNQIIKNEAFRHAISNSANIHEILLGAKV